MSALPDEGVKRRQERLTPWSDEQLARGRRLVADHDAASFALGDLAIEIAGPSSRQGHRNGSYAVLFAEVIGMSGEGLARYRQVASAWPEVERIEGASWTLHQALVNQPDRHDVLADFIATARRERFNPSRTRLLAHLRARPVEATDEHRDKWHWTRQIATDKAYWHSTVTGERLEWTLHRRRATTLLIAVESVADNDRGDPVIDEVFEGHETLMADVLAIADVLPAMRRAFGTYVGVTSGDPEFAEDVVTEGRLPDVEALSILWRAMLGWSWTPDGSVGWKSIASSLHRRVRDAEVRNASDVVDLLLASHRVLVACMLSGDHSLVEFGRELSDAASAVVDRLRSLRDNDEGEL